MHSHQNLLPEPGPTLLPGEPAAEAALARGDDPAAVAAAHPTASIAWGALAEAALVRGDTSEAGVALGATIEAYAYARTGYHRGLDALRRQGWKGFGPVPWSHEPNRGFLRCLGVLAKATAAIQETDEAVRCAQFLRDCDPAAADIVG